MFSHESRMLAAQNQKPMKKIIQSVRSSFRRAGVIVGAAMLAAAIQSATAQSIGVNFVNDGSGGVVNSAAASLLPSEVAGAPGYAQANWNNLSKYGSGIALNDSTGAATSLAIKWDAGWTDTSGTAAGLGTPAGKLMDGSLGGNSTITDYTALSAYTDVYSMPGNAKPMVYVSGLNSWYQSQGAAGYAIVIYENSHNWYDTDEAWIESVTGSPFDNSMAAGPDLTPHLFNQLNTVFSGTYVKIPAGATSVSTRASGANYCVFTTLTNDAVLIRTGDTTESGWGNGSMNGFQIVPVFAALPSVGVHFVKAGGSYVNNSSPDALAPTDSAGVSDYAQTNWNNLGAYGDSAGWYGTAVVLNDSTGAATPLSIMWDNANVGSTGTAAGLGTPNGKLMDGYLTSYSPGAATPVSYNPYNAPANDKPLAYIGGLNAWCQGTGAAGYNVVIYTTGTGYYETAEGFLESVTGNPFWYQMVEGDVLRPPLFAADTGSFSGTYVPVAGTSSASKTYGGNCMTFYGLTNDAVLIRLQSLGYRAGLSGFQIVPVASIAPVVPPVVTLNSTVTGSTNVLNWSAGTLQTATNLLGPWTYNYTPSPVTTTMTNAGQFYRVWVQE
jgi:hypothetical protein